uniref:Uncharacterized protein n=1 Tax=Anguilla anguilla TaxID=7936 RepID=A0A0E9SAT9_ANGAN
MMLCQACPAAIFLFLFVLVASCLKFSLHHMKHMCSWMQITLM